MLPEFINKVRRIVVVKKEMRKGKLAMMFRASSKIEHSSALIMTGLLILEYKWQFSRLSFLSIFKIDFCC